MIVDNSCTVVPLEAQGHGEGGRLGLCGIVRVEVLNFDLLLVFIGIVEDNDLHGLLERLWVFEIYLEATLTEFILWSLASLVKLTVKSRVLGRWRSLSTLFCNFVSCSWRLYLEVDLLVLLLFALLLHKTFVPHFIIMLILLFLGCVLRLLTLQKLLVILLILQIRLDLSLRFSTST